MDPSTAVMWFRRDLRLGDHPALTGALAAHRRVVPLFVWDPALVSSAGAPRLAFLARCLAGLDRSLGGRLVVRGGDPVRVVAEVASAVGATEVWCTEDFGPYGRRRDAAVARALSLRAPPISLRPVGSPYAVAPGALHTRSGSPYQVFTAYRRAWEAQGWGAPLPVPRLARVSPAGLAAAGPPGEIPTPPTVGARLPEGGEQAAHRRLDAFLADALASYGRCRDRPDLDGTSRLSPFLRFGCLHPRQLLARLDHEDPAHRRFAAELCWRDFYADVLFQRPDSAWHPYRRQLAGLACDEGPDADRRFEAWTEGRTGFPVVDAGMRQLRGDAWVHNRVRMIAASFLVKDLHLAWQRGARWFMAHLVDGDLASNQHGWQWVAGTGTDASPYHRIFNPVAQGKRFDPDGAYVRRWVPELGSLRGAAVHEPWASPGVVVGQGGDYPAPIVDHLVERREALARYAAVREVAALPAGRSFGTLVPGPARIRRER